MTTRRTFLGRTLALFAGALGLSCATREPIPPTAGFLHYERCAGQTRTGERCPRRPTVPGGWCRYHEAARLSEPVTQTLGPDCRYVRTVVTMTADGRSAADCATRVEGWYTGVGWKALPPDDAGIVLMPYPVTFVG